MTEYQAKLELPVGAVNPDSYLTTDTFPPSDAFVVSRRRDGTTASCYGAWSWDMSAYHPDGRTTFLHFTDGAEKTTRSVSLAQAAAAKKLLFAVVWLRPGNPLSLATVGNYHIAVMSLAHFADETSVDLIASLANERWLMAFARQTNATVAKVVTTLLSALASIGSARIAVTVVGKKALESLRQLARTRKAHYRQHAPIPTRLYSLILAQLHQELLDWLEVADDMLALASTCAKDRQVGRTRVARKLNAKRDGTEYVIGPDFPELAPPTVISYMERRNLPINVRGLSRALHEVQWVAKLTIQAYSGMRDNEVIALPFECLETEESGGRTHYILLGRTTKLSLGLIKRTRWVTNREGAKAVRVLQAIARTIYGTLDVVPEAQVGRLNDHPLVLSVGNLKFAGRLQPSAEDQYLPMASCFNHFPDLRARLQPAIEETDIRELEHIDPHRAWRSEPKFKTGQGWTLTGHQLRRSLALYAQRSGLVSLPSLRRQLQHITEEMSRYYANGSSFANDFIGNNKKHFGVEWRDTKTESAALSYIINVLLSDETLVGGHANWVAHRLKGPDGVLLLDRNDTMRQFKRGELAYQETPLGGCTKVGDCDRPALDWLNIECLRNNCRNMVCSVPKLDRVIRAQEHLVAGLDPKTVQYRTEKADLAALVAARSKVLDPKADGQCPIP
ncbi:hypothetical protein ACQCQP_10760 [Ralstonia pseudosolanacearum]|uniref:hypothetical protein n=1 Tax=Ralstonia pseudosolanacearum TaxID=1310165 RepID=UPI003CE9F1A2